MVNLRAALGFAILACAACSDSPTAPSGARFVTSLRLSGTSFAPGETVTWNLSVTNSGDTAGQLDFSGCQATFRVHGANGVVWDEDWVRLCIAALTRVELAPGQTQSYAGSWRQQTLQGNAPPGLYRAQGELLTLSRLPSPEVSFSITSQ